LTSEVRAPKPGGSAVRPLSVRKSSTRRSRRQKLSGRRVSALLFRPSLRAAAPGGGTKLRARRARRGGSGGSARPRPQHARARAPLQRRQPPEALRQRRERVAHCIQKSEGRQLAQSLWQRGQPVSRQIQVGQRRQAADAVRQRGQRIARGAERLRRSVGRSGGRANGRIGGVRCGARLPPPPPPQPPARSPGCPPKRVCSQGSQAVGGRRPHREAGEVKKGVGQRRELPARNIERRQSQEIRRQRRRRMPQERGDVGIGSLLGGAGGLLLLLLRRVGRRRRRAGGGGGGVAAAR